jgi:hypothetical protein
MQINSAEEADKVVHNFTVSIASVYRLSTSKVTFSALIRICVVWRVCHYKSGDYGNCKK